MKLLLISSTVISFFNGLGSPVNGCIISASSFLNFFLKNSVANLNISQGNAANFPSSSSTFGFWYCFLFDILTALNIFSWYSIYYIHWPVDLSFPIVLFIWCCILFISAFKFFLMSSSIVSSNSIHSNSASEKIFLHYMYCKYSLFSSHVPLFCQLLISYLAVDWSHFPEVFYVSYWFSSIDFTIVSIPTLTSVSSIHAPSILYRFWSSSNWHLFVCLLTPRTLFLVIVVYLLLSLRLDVATSFIPLPICLYIFIFWTIFRIQFSHRMIKL